MAGHTSDPRHDSLLEDFTPVTALESGLDLGSWTDFPEFIENLDQIDWDGCTISMAGDNAPEAPQQPNETHDEVPEETFLKSVFDVSAVQPENYPLLDFPYYLNQETAATPIASAKKPHSTSQDTVDPADLIGCVGEDWSDIFGTSDRPGYDLNESFSEDYELPDNRQGLDFLHNLHLIGNESAGSSELNPKTEHRAVLTDAPRIFKGHHGTKRKHYVPNKAYKPLDQPPKAWEVFQYTIDGELDPSRVFTAEEINRYLFNHPLHSGYHNLRDSQLRLRVHRTPAASAKRFPNGLRCRFQDCPMGTIGQGQYLVIVDELSVRYPNHDLFLNAAYMHLWCMEHFCNFEGICANLNVSAKSRNARWEEGRRNRFCLGSEEERVVEDWIEACRAHSKHGVGGKPWVTTACPDQPNGCPHYDSPNLEYRGTLCHQLTVTKLHYGGQGRINLRKGREDRAGYKGANITRHVGDLSKETGMREFSRCHRNQNQLKRCPKTERQYRGGDGIREEDQAQGTKRNRDEGDDGQMLDHDVVQTTKKPKFKLPIWDQDPDICLVCSPRISPRTTLTPWSQQTRLELQMTTTRPSQNARFTSVNNVRLTELEDESEGEMELEILAAQRRRRLLEIEDAKDREKECRLRMLKLEEASKKKRLREGGDDDDRYGTEAREKRQRVG